MSIHRFYNGACRAQSFEWEADYFYPYPKPPDFVLPEGDQNANVSICHIDHLTQRRKTIIEVFDKFLCKYPLFRKTFIKNGNDLYFRYKFDEFTPRQCAAAHILMGYGRNSWVKPVSKWTNQDFYQSIKIQNPDSSLNRQVIQFFLFVSGSLDNNIKSWYDSYPHGFTPATMKPSKGRKLIRIPSDYLLSEQERKTIASMGLTVVSVKPKR